MTKRVYLTLFMMISICFSNDSYASTSKEGERVYKEVSQILKKEQTNLSYHSLINVLNMLDNAGEDFKIPKLDKLIWALTKTRSEHPRVDSMILIFSSMIIQNSKQRISGVHSILKSLIDDKRNSVWVVIFISGAFSDYPFTIWGGSRLMSKLENRLDVLIKYEQNNPGEYYGTHFMEPPQTVYMKSYVIGLSTSEKRKSARMNYYNLRINYSEDNIIKALAYLDKNGDLQSGEKVDYALRYLSSYIDIVLKRANTLI